MHPVQGGSPSVGSVDVYQCASIEAPWYGVLSLVKGGWWAGVSRVLFQRCLAMVAIATMERSRGDAFVKSLMACSARSIQVMT